MQSPTGTQQEHPITTSSNGVPGLATAVFQPTYPYVGPTPLSWSGPQVSAPVPSTADNASLIKELADAITGKKNDSLPEWKLAQYNGDPLQWHEWYGQFKSAIDSRRSLMTLNRHTSKHSSTVKQRLQSPSLLTVL